MLEPHWNTPVRAMETKKTMSENCMTCNIRITFTFFTQVTFAVNCNGMSVILVLFHSLKRAAKLVFKPSN